MKVDCTPPWDKLGRKLILTSQSPAILALVNLTIARSPLHLENAFLWSFRHSYSCNSHPIHLNLTLFLQLLSIGHLWLPSSPSTNTLNGLLYPSMRPLVSLRNILPSYASSYVSSSAQWSFRLSLFNHLNHHRQLTLNHQRNTISLKRASRHNLLPSVTSLNFGVYPLAWPWIWCHIWSYLRLPWKIAITPIQPLHLLFPKSCSYLINT